MTTDWTTPLLRWAGSKRRLIGTLRAAMPEQWDRYVEPFAGSACLFFSLRPQAALLGDFNQELVHFYETLRKHPRLVARQVHAFGRTPRDYYRVRAIPFASLDAITRAAHFIYLNRLCFNGVYRTNRSGQFNVPIGKNTGEIPDETRFYRCSVALRSATVKAADFEETCDGTCTGDFVYLDPPYTSTNRKRYGEYGYASFQPIELQRLTNCLKAIDKRGAHFLLSYTDNTGVRKRLSAWNVRSLTVRRHVSGFAKHRRHVRELLVSNYEIKDCV